MNATLPVARGAARLTRLRLRLWWNTLKHSSLRRKIAYGIAGVGLLAFAGFLLFISWGILALLNNPEITREMARSGVEVDLAGLLDQLPVLFAAMAFLGGVFTSFGVLLQSLYLAGDMEFLLTAPVPPRAVFISKLIQAIFPSLALLSLISLPALVGLGITRAYHPVYFFALPVVLVLLIVSGAGLSALLVMAVVRVVAPRRAAEVLGVLGGVVGVLCSQSGQLANRWEVSPGQVSEALGTLEGVLVRGNPLSWPGLGLVAIGQRQWGLAAGFSALTLVITLGLLTLSLTTAERLYFSGWSRVQVGTTGRRRRRERRRPGGPPMSVLQPLRRLLPVPVLAVLAKDARMYRRDLRSLSQLITPILFAVIWTFTLPGAGSEGTASPTLQRFIGLGSVGIALFVGWMFAMRFAMGGLSIEGRQWWILKTAPLRRGHLLLSKFLMAYLPSAGLSLLYLIVLAVLRDGSSSSLAYQLVVIAIILAAECGLLLAFGIWNARFDWDNPAEITGGASGCVGTLIGMAFLGVAGAIFLGLPLVGERLGLSSGVAQGIGFTLGLVLSLAVGLGPLLLAGRRVPTLGED